MGKKVLVVDDSSIILHFHTAVLEHAGFEVDTALNGYIALEKLVKDNFDLIVTDVNMANLDGYAFISKIRELEPYEDTPIVIVTTESVESEREKGYKLGADLFITKPIEPNEFIPKIKMLIDPAG